jgi:Dual specificity phosphatase, catalytic domain
MYTDDELSDHSEDERLYEDFLLETDGGTVEINPQTEADVEVFREDPPVEVISGLSFGNWYHGDKHEHAFDVVYSLGFPVSDEALYETEGEKYVFFDIGDTLDEDITEALLEITESIHSALTLGRRVYVHCHLGQSRSTTVLIAYLIRYLNMTPKAALQLIRLKREQADPNNSFRKQLNAYWRRSHGPPPRHQVLPLAPGAS